MVAREGEPVLTVDIVSDVVCPWCFIGRRRLDVAIGEWGRDGGSALQIRWHPFELNPDLPLAGMPRAQYVERKFGSRSREVYDRVARVGRDVGIAFAFERIERQPNTRPAHALIAAAPAGAVQDAVADALFRAYFLDGRDLSDARTLIEVATGAGLAEGVAREALDDPALAGRIEAAETRAWSLGIGGVPYFIFGERIAVSGAQEPPVLLEALRRARPEAAPAPR